LPEAPQTLACVSICHGGNKTNKLQRLHTWATGRTQPGRRPGDQNANIDKKGLPHTIKQALPTKAKSPAPEHQAATPGRIQAHTKHQATKTKS